MAYLALEAAGAAIEEALEPACAYHGCSLARVGALFTVFFRETAPKNFAQARECDLEAFADFFNAALAGGVYLPSSQFESASFSFTLQGDDLEDAIAGLTAAFVAVEG
jgi:glutamate-1-semialdehyde 2,1-aminomutase